MNSRQRNTLRILLWPGATWIILFFIIPSLLVVLYSFLSRQSGGGVIWEFSLAAYAKLLAPSDGYLLNDFSVIFLRSLWWALLTSLICLVLGYPLAFFIVLQPAHHRSTYLFLVMIPFWTNFLVRTYAWKFILNNNGLLNTMLQAFDLPRLPIINTPTAVMIGLVYGSLPFMVLPLYASIEKLDFNLIEAAQDLGANYFQVFRRVIFPITFPGVVAGTILVFIPVSGQYIVPTILGGGRVFMLGNLLAQQFGSAGDWPFGAAIAVIFMVLLMIGVIYHIRSEIEQEEVSA